MAYLVCLICYINFFLHVTPSIHLGPNGEPLRDVARNLPSLQSNGNNNSAPAPVAPPITNAASLLGQPNLASNLAALSALSGVNALSNLSTAAGLSGLGLGGALNNASDSNPAFSTSAAYNTNSSLQNRSSNDFDLGVRSYNTANDDFRGGFGNGRENTRQSDTIIIRNVRIFRCISEIKINFQNFVASCFLDLAKLT